MSAGPDPPRPDRSRYEAFLVLSDGASHAVIAIISDPTRAQAQRLACLEDAARAARLADALNSRLLGRPNHGARLRAALDGLQLTVRAAIRQIPTSNPDNPAVDLLADHLPGDPIDGLLLFPTTFPTTPTSGCAPTFTPRTAHAVGFAAEDVGDLCHEAANAVDVQAARRFLPRLPVPIRRQRPEQLLRVAADLDQLAATLRDGLPPDARTAASRLAVRLAVDHADRLHQDDPEIFSDGSRLLPTSAHDYDFAALRHHLLADADQPRVARMTLRTT